ncbi:MAG: hypothetical protein ACT4OY_08445 [Alphaproteobacteria bacterium]
MSHNFIEKKMISLECKTSEKLEQITSWLEKKTGWVWGISTDESSRDNIEIYTSLPAAVAVDKSGDVNIFNRMFDTNDAEKIIKEIIGDESPLMIKIKTLKATRQGDSDNACLLNFVISDVSKLDDAMKWLKNHEKDVQNIIDSFILKSHPTSYFLEILYYFEPEDCQECNERLDELAYVNDKDENLKKEYSSHLKTAHPERSLFAEFANHSKYKTIEEMIEDTSLKKNVREILERLPVFKNSLEHTAELL